MSESHENNNVQIPKLTCSKGYALCRIYVMEMMRKDGDMNALTNDAPGGDASTAVINCFNKTEENAEAHIALNLGEEPATLVTSLLI